MDNTLTNVQDGGMFGLFKSDTEKKTKDLNHRLKVLIEGRKKGEGSKIRNQFKSIIFEEESTVIDLVNSNFSIKKDFYRIIKQWCDLYSNGKVEQFDKASNGYTQAYGFLKFLEDLGEVFGKPEDKVDSGSKTIYTDVDFFDILFPKIKEFMNLVIKDISSGKTSKGIKTGMLMSNIINVLSSYFSTILNDHKKLKTIQFCTLIINSFIKVMSEEPMAYISYLEIVYKQYPIFSKICPVNKLVDATLNWLEHDKATGKEAQNQRFDKIHYNAILAKLTDFYKLEEILNLENNKKFKEILYGSKTEKGKIIKWMMYIRQYKKQMKNEDKKDNIKIPSSDGKMNYPNYDKTFLIIFSDLMDKTYPNFFRTDYANIEKPRPTGFFTNLKNVFSGNTSPDKYFNIIKNDLYFEIIKWLNSLQNVGDYVTLLKKVSDIFPDIIDSNKFLTYTKLNQKLLNIVSPAPINNKTGKPIFNKTFSFVKRDLEKLGRLLQDHIKEGNHIHKLYNNKEFNNLFYIRLKQFVEDNERDARKLGFTLVDSTSEGSNFNQLQDRFNISIIEKVQPKIGINIDTMEELTELLDNYYDIISIEQLLPRKITNQPPMENTEIISKTKAIPLGKKTFSNQQSKDMFHRILIDAKDSIGKESQKTPTTLHYLDVLIEPDRSLSWHLTDEFYTKDKDGTIRRADGSSYGDNKSYGDLEKPQRRTTGDLIADAQTDEVSQILQDNLPEVSKLSGEIANLLKIIDDQGKKLEETDSIIDALINDESSILEEVSDKVESVNNLISSNDLDTLIKKKRGRPKKRKKVVTVEVEESKIGGKKKCKKMLIGTYTITKNKTKNLYKMGDIFYYVNDNNKRKKVDCNSSRINF